MAEKNINELEELYQIFTVGTGDTERKFYTTCKDEDLDEVIENAGNDLLFYCDRLKESRELLIRHNYEETVKSLDLTNNDKLLVIFLYHELVKPAYKDIDKIDFIKNVKINPAKNEDGIYSKIMLESKTFLDVMETILNSENYKDIAFYEIVLQSIDRNKDANGTLIAGSLLDKIFKETESIINKREIVEIDNIKAIKPNDFKLPVSKLHNNIFDSLFNEHGQVSGQISFLDPSTFDTESDNNNLIELCVGAQKDENRADRLILYGIDQDELDGLNISREIDSYDQRVYDAMCTLYDCGNKIITLTQIYRTMGGKGNPKKGDLQKINNSVVKLWSTKVFVDETKDYKEYLPKDGKIKHRGRILNISFKDAYIHNKYVESAILFLEEPYLLNFSKRRKQIEAIPRNVIENNKRMTNKNLAIENYLLTRISRMKSAKRNNKTNTSNRILFDKIIEKAHEKNKPDRVITTARDYLEHYKSDSVKWIVGYKEKDGYFEIEL